MESEACLAPLAERLVAPLAARYPIAELFFEEVHAVACSRGALRFEPPTVRRFHGASLRVMGPDSRANAACSRLDATGVRALALRLGAPAIRALGVPEAVRLPPIERQPTAWIEALNVLHRRVAAACGGHRAECHLDWEDCARGVILNRQKPRAWRGTRAALRVDLRSDDGTVVSRARLLDASRPRPDDAVLERLCHDLLDAIDRNRGRRSAPRGHLPVVVAPGAGAVLFHEIAGHPLEADFVLSELSPFSSLSFGDRVSVPELTVYDSPDPALGAWGFAIDDDGTRARKAPLIEQGLAVGMMHDRATAYRSGARPTGNARRARYFLEPEPRMRTIVVAAGREDPAALLSGIADGIYVKRWGAGRSNLDRGRFSLEVEQALRIRSGRLAERVSGVHVRGGILAALRAVEGIGRDAEVHPEPIPCAKGGIVMTGVAGPTVRFSSLEVA